MDLRCWETKRFGFHVNITIFAWNEVIFNVKIPSILILMSLSVCASWMELKINMHTKCLHLKRIVYLIRISSALFILTRPIWHNDKTQFWWNSFHIINIVYIPSRFIKYLILFPDIPWEHFLFCLKGAFIDLNSTELHKGNTFDKCCLTSVHQQYVGDLRAV